MFEVTRRCHDAEKRDGADVIMLRTRICTSYGIDVEGQVR